MLHNTQMKTKCIASITPSLISKAIEFQHHSLKAFFHMRLFQNNFEIERHKRVSSSSIKFTLKFNPKKRLQLRRIFLFVFFC